MTIGVGLALWQANQNSGGSPIITATLNPATSVLASGQALDDTTNWATFLLASNYSSSDPGDVDTPTVTVNYIGDTPDATTELWGGEVNHFSITVTYLSGNTRTFTTTLRTVAQTDMVMTAQTTGASEQFTFEMGTSGPHNFVIDWGDGSTSTITSSGDADRVHTYTAANTYTIRARGTCGSVRFGNTPSNAAKIRTVSNLGQMGWADMLLAFSGASGMTSFVAGNTDTSACPNWFSAFAGLTNCSTFNAAGLDFSAATNLQAAWANNGSLATITGLDFSTAQVLQRGDEMFINTPAGATVDFSGIGIDKLIGWDNRTGNQRSLFDALSPTAVGSQTFYDQTLINFAAQLPTDNGLPTTEMFLGMGDTVYTTGGAAEAARLSLINAGWWITDAGNGVPEVAAAPTLVVNSSSQITATLPADPFGNGRFVTGRALEYRIGAGSWTSFGSGYTEGQAVPITGLDADTLYEIRGVFTNFDGSTNGTSASATTEEAVVFGVEDSGEEPVITYDTGGVFSFTFDGDTYTTDYLGTTLNTSAFGAGPDYTPICFVQSAITEAGTSEGDTFTGVPAQFLYIGADPGDATYDWLEDGVSTGNGTTSYVVPAASVGVDVVFRTVYDGVTVDSDPVTITSATTVPDAFVDANWSVATGSGPNELDITIASLPSDGGATITDIEYDVASSGTWISLGGTTGPFTITMAAPATSYAIRLRAVNSVGPALDGNSESATSGAAAFAPTDLPLVFWHDFTDSAALFADTGRTVAITNGVGVDGVTDKSGNGNHGSTASCTVNWDSANQQCTVVPGTGGRIDIPSVSGFTSTTEFYFAIRTADTVFLLFANSTGRFVGAADGTGSPPDNAAGSPTYHVNNGSALSPDTRATISAALSIDTPLVASARLADFAAANGSTVNMFRFGGGGFDLSGTVTHVIATEALTAGQRSDLQTYLSTRLPV